MPLTQTGKGQALLDPIGEGKCGKNVPEKQAETKQPKDSQIRGSAAVSFATFPFIWRS